jgi:hypothetical protein
MSGDDGGGEHASLDTLPSFAGEYSVTLSDEHGNHVVEVV